MNKERAQIMAFWDELKAKVTVTSKKAVDKTKDLTEVAKLKLTIVDQGRKISASYEKIGRAYAEANVESDGKLLPEEFAAIDEANAKIAECTDRLRELKGLLICANCGKEISDDVKFCPACGTAVEKKVYEGEVIVEPVAEPKVCIKCGAALEKGAEFCTECGSKIEK